MSLINFNNTGRVFTNGIELSKMYTNNILLWEKRDSSYNPNNIEKEILNNANDKDYGGKSTDLRWINDISYDYTRDRFYVGATKNDNRGKGIIYITDTKIPIYSTILYDGNISCICCGNGIVVGSYSKDLIYSTDGINFTKKGYNFKNVVNSICYADNKFIAVGKSGYVATSIDGITWENIDAITDMDLYSVDYGNGRIVAVGNRQEVIVSDNNGVTWDRIKSLSYEKIHCWYKYVKYNEKYDCFYLTSVRGSHQPTYLVKIDSDLKVTSLIAVNKADDHFVGYDLLTKGDITMVFISSATRCKEALTYDNKNYNIFTIYHSQKRTLTKGCWGKHRIIMGSNNGYIKYLSPYIE